MNLRNILLAASCAFCFCSLTAAQDLMLSQIHSDGLYLQQGPNPQPGFAVSSLPSDVFGAADDDIASIHGYIEEEAAVERANMLILTGIAGAMVAGLSAAGLLYSLRRKAKQRSAKGIQIVGI